MSALKQIVPNPTNVAKQIGVRETFGYAFVLWQRALALVESPVVSSYGGFPLPSNGSLRLGRIVKTFRCTDSTFGDS